jgi:MoxR-like ATPase
MSYPDEASEFALLSTGNQSVQARLESVAPVLTRESLMSLRQQVERVHVEESVRHYIVNLLRATRSTEVLKLGASPRAGLMLQSAARANALRLGRAFVLPEDVKDVALGVLRHRLALSTEAELDGMNIEDALTLILDRVALRG